MWWASKWVEDDKFEYKWKHKKLGITVEVHFIKYISQPKLQSLQTKSIIII